MFQNLNDKSNKESHYIAINLQPRFDCAISRICEYYFIDRQDKTNTLLESHLLIYKINKIKHIYIVKTYKSHCYKSYERLLLSYKTYKSHCYKSYERLLLSYKI